jgi:hypothetical protein
MKQDLNDLIKEVQELYPADTRTKASIIREALQLGLNFMKKRLK